MTNTKSTKRALLASVMAMLLCFTMLLGTTFAWFTDEATTGVNTIQSGKLDVTLQDETGSSLEGKTLNFANADGSIDILWEPGATFETQSFKIANVGNLAIKYKIALNGIQVNDSKLMEVLTFKVLDAQGNAIDLSSYEAYLEANQTSELLKLQAAMDEDAGNEYMDIIATGVSITVYATQYTSEKDITDNQYDKEATYSDEVTYVTTADELISAFAQLKDGDIISLGADIDLTGKTWTPAKNTSFTLNGNNYAIKNLTYVTTDQYAGGLVSTTAAKDYTFKNLTLENPVVKSTGTDSSGEYSYAAAFVAYADTASSVNITNCHIKNATIESQKYAAGFIAVSSGYGNLNDGPVYGSFNVTNCSMNGGSISSDKGSVGVAFGHAGWNDATDSFVDGLAVTGVSINGEDDAHTGIVIGTAGVGYTEIKNVNITNVTSTDNDLATAEGTYDLVGRFVPNNVGTLIIDGTTYAAFKDGQ